MVFTWFKIFNLTLFTATGLVSRKITLELEGLGAKDFLITKGNLTSILFDGVFLSINMNDQNPFIFEGFAVYLDDNDDVWLGIEVDET